MQDEEQVVVQAVFAPVETFVVLPTIMVLLSAKAKSCTSVPNKTEDKNQADNINSFVFIK